MNNKQFIDYLSQKNANYNDPEQAINQANSLQLLSADIYVDSQRFIYELLQNADDASNQYGKLDVQIDFIGTFVVISHKGEAFSEIDIESIASAGDGTKAGDANKTGFKGIGFKSVFSHSNFVIIKSGNFCFKFDKQHWINHWNNAWGSESDWKSRRRMKQKDEQIKMPWQIIPIWAELSNELNQPSIFQEFNVSTVIKYDKIEQLKIALCELFSESQIVLFLRSKEVQITINTHEKLILEKSKIGEITTLKRNGVVLSEWLVKTEQFDVPIAVQTIIIEDEKSPKKLKEAKRTEISFAVQLDKGKLKAVDKENRLIFTYLPTSINCDFPFLVNASFLTDAGRQHLHQDIFWNNWIFEQIPLKFFAWLAELAQKTSKYNKQFLRVIPNKLGGHTALGNSFNTGYKQALESVAFIPNLQGDLLKVKETIFDKTNISGFISKQTVVNYINGKTKSHFSISSFVPYLEPISTLSQLGTEMLEIEDLEDFFASEIFSNEHQLFENFKLISFLYEQAQRGKGEDGRNIWNEKLKHTPFIFDESQKLKKPQFIYFPAVEFSDEFNDDISIIHENIVSQINTNQRIKNWLEYLGVKEPSDISFIEKTIIAQADTFITEDNALQIGKYLFNAHKKGLLQDEHYQDLQNFKLLTKHGSLISAIDTYLSDFYEPDLRIEKVYVNDFYVSETYFESKDLKSEWKTFLIKIGVNETISWIKKRLSRFELQNKYPYYFQTIPSGMPNRMYGFENDFHTYEFNQLSFIELAGDYYFSKNFWKIIFSNNINIRSGHIDLGIGFYNSSINSLNNWIVTNLPIIPTTQRKCFISTEVYSTAIQQIREIAGKYLPVIDYDDAIPPTWLSYLNFKNTLSIDEYLQVLAGIWQDTSLGEFEQKENQKRIGLIYEKLACMNLHTSEKEEIKEWSKTNKLLAKNGTDFFYPQELSIVTVEGFRASNLAFAEKVSLEIIELLRVFGVSIIDKVTPTISNSKVEIKGLKNKLLQISPLVALVAVEKSKNRKDWETEFERIKNKLSCIHFYETSEIFLSYGNEEDKQKRSSWADNDNFFYVGDWFSPRILDGLVEPLGKFLNIRYAERILTVLLLETFAGGVEYLIEKDYDISIIPDELLNPKEPETFAISQINRPYNQSDEDLGNKGEKFVYEELKRIYAEKYKLPIEETLTGFKIGNKVEVLWRNISANTTEDHDFKIVELGRDIYIESKATPYSKNVEKVALFISGKELALMETSEKYLIARVFLVTTNPEMELIKLEISTLMTNNK